MREIQTGDWVTVDGYLGIVSLGKAEFDLELGERPGSATEAVSYVDPGRSSGLHDRADGLETAVDRQYLPGDPARFNR
jgi:hypothetical protein